MFPRCYHVLFNSHDTVKQQHVLTVQMFYLEQKVIGEFACLPTVHQFSRSLRKEHYILLRR
jgi:hypothetical protein